MADWTKKIIKSVGEDLEPGEVVRVGVFLQPTGTTTSMVARGVGGMIGAAVAQRLSTGEPDELVTDSGIAATMPDERIVLGLTDRRLLVWGQSAMSAKPKGLKLTMPAGDVTKIDLEKQKATFKFTIRFSDGTAKAYEAPKVSNDPEGFAAAISP